MNRVLAACLLLASTVQAAELPPPAYQLAGHAAQVPSAVLYAIALQESGVPLRGRLRPWPWSLNVAGESYRFTNRRAACSALLLAVHEVGAKRVDVGLGQVNLGWNGHRFDSPCAALDPRRNLQVTAQILREQRERSSDWVTAAGRYHRPAGGAPAARYQASFRRHLARVRGVDRDLLAKAP